MSKITYFNLITKITVKIKAGRSVIITGDNPQSKANQVSDSILIKMRKGNPVEGWIIRDQAIDQSPSDYCIAQGLSGLTPVMEYTGKSRQTLQNWHKDQPDLFRVVVNGCVPEHLKKLELVA